MDAVDAAKATTIYVNARPKQWTEKEITFDQVVKLAYDPVPSGPLVEITVSYRKGEHGKAGTLTAGDSVKVHKDMVFNVVVTDKS
jgi:hypothetical protein